MISMMPVFLVLSFSFCLLSDLCVHVFASLVATFVVNKHLHYGQWSK